MLTHSDVDKALYVVRASGAVALFDAMLPKRKPGRPSGLTNETFLVGSLLTALNGDGMILADIYKILTQQMPFDRQVELGIRPSISAAPTFSQDSVDRRMSAFLAAMEHGEGSAPQLDESERKTRHWTLLTFFDQMLDQTLLSSSQYLSIDSSGVWAYARAPKKRGLNALLEEIEELRKAGKHDDADILKWHTDKMLSEQQKRDKKGSAKNSKASTDTDEGVLLPTRGHDPDAQASRKTRKDGKTEWYYGYELHAVALAADPGSTYTDVPNLVARFDVTPAGRGVIDASRGLVSRLPDWARPGTIIGDRLYSNLKRENWYDHLAAEGFRQVVDMRETDQAWTDVDGMRTTAGWCHCPATPMHLEKIARPVGVPSQEFRERIAERWSYAAEIKDRTAEWRRYQCPALKGKLRCPLRPGSLAAGADLPLVQDPPKKDTAPAICTQQSVKVHANQPNAQGKLWQDHYWGSDPQLRQMARRTSIEQVFAKRKDRHGTNLDRGFVRVSGLTAMTFALGMVVLAGNIRDLEAWVGNGHCTLDTSHPLLQPRSSHVVLHLDHQQALDYEEFLRTRRPSAA